MRIAFTADERPALVARLGLPDTASDEDVAVAATSLLTASTTPPDPNPRPATTDKPAPPAPPAPGNEPQTDPPNQPSQDEPTTPPQTGRTDNPPDSPVEARVPDDDDDIVVLDVQAYRSLTQRATLAGRLQEEERVQRRDRLIDDAIKAGKFAPSRRDHYKARFDSDEENTTKLLARMRDNTVPIAERGYDASEEDVDDQTDYPREWVPEVAARQNGGSAAHSAAQPPSRPSRIQVEE